MHTFATKGAYFDRGKGNPVTRTTLNLDTDLAADAKRALGAKSVTETIHLALGHVIRQQRLDRLAERDFSALTPEMLDRLRDRGGDLQAPTK